jgi:hypothetical protein
MLAETGIDYAGIAIDAIRDVQRKGASMSEAQIVIADALINAHGKKDMRKAIERMADLMGVTRG